MNEVNTGKADLLRLSIKNVEESETSEISRIFNSFRYFESIFKPSISLVIDITDTISLQQQLPILGGETVDIEFVHQSNNEDKNRIRKKLKIFEIDNVDHSNQARKSYSLHAISEEFFKNEREDMLVISGFYQQTAKSIVQNIYTNYIKKISNKPLVTVEDTYGLLKIAFPSNSTFAALNMVCQQAESIKNKSSNFLFFENNKGYHFTTIENLFNQKPKEQFFDDVNLSKNDDDDNKIKNYQKIVSKNYINTSDVLNASLSGKFANKVFYLDPISKTIESTSYNYSKNFKENVHSQGINSKPVLSEKHIELLSASPTTESFLTTNYITSQKSAYVRQRDDNISNIVNAPIRIQNFIGREMAATNQLQNQKMNITIPGNTEISAGDIVELFFNLNDTTTQARGVNDYTVSGKWLVTSLCHQVNSDGEFMTYLECMKDSYTEAPKHEVI